MKMAKIQIYRWWSPHSTECCTIESHNTNWSPNQYGKERNTGFVLWKTVAVFNMSV